jgi:hypothetical protein
LLVLCPQCQNGLQTPSDYRTLTLPGVLSTAWGGVAPAGGAGKLGNRGASAQGEARARSHAPTSPRPG